MPGPIGPEQRLKISESLKRYKALHPPGPHKPERSARIAAALRGKPKSEAHRAAIRASKQNVSAETRAKMSVIRSGKAILATRGPNHWRWSGGQTAALETGRIRNSLEYKTWRTAVFERDDFTCQSCGVRNGVGLGHTVRLEADHIKAFREYPELRFDVSNGRTLCYPCHRKTPTWGPRRRLLDDNEREIPDSGVDAGGRGRRAPRIS